MKRAAADVRSLPLINLTVQAGSLPGCGFMGSNHAASSWAAPASFARRRGLGAPVIPVAVSLFACAAFGCKSYSPSQYVSPRVVGSVLDARTRQPIRDVEVRRARDEEIPRPMDPQKGGQRLKQPPVVRTDKEGSFVLESVRELAFLRKLGWYSVALSLEHPRYEPFSTNYTLANSTNTASGEPLVDAGEILLTPLRK
jgi:hypothetical protein